MAEQQTLRINVATQNHDRGTVWFMRCDQCRMSDGRCTYDISAECRPIKYITARVKCADVQPRKTMPVVDVKAVVAREKFERARRVVRRAIKIYVRERGK